LKLKLENMKKILLFITLSMSLSLAFSQAPDFQILNVTYTTQNDTLKPVITLKADTALQFTVGVFISKDQNLDETDELRLFSTNTSQKNATLTLNGTLNFAGQLIDSNAKYLITIVTHKFEGTAQDFNLKNLKADKNPLDNFRVTPYMFPAAIVKTHNAPLTNTGGGSNMTFEQAVALLTMPSFEPTSFVGAGTFWEATNSPVFDVQYKKTFKIKNGMPQDLTGAIVKVYLSKDNIKDDGDFEIHQKTMEIAKETEVFHFVDGTKRLSATTKPTLVTEASKFVYWSNNTPVYGDLAKSYVFVAVTFVLGDTLTATKTFGFGGTSTFTYKTFVVNGLEDNNQKSNVFVSTLGNNVFGIETSSISKSRVYSNTGTLILEQNLSSGSNQLSLEGQKSGIYIVSVETETGVSTERVLVD
jgi:hypothetical protein